MQETPSHLNISKNEYIAYHKTNGKKNTPGIVFLGGFMSDMTGTKATALEQWAQKNNQSYIRFDYFGHGQSSGKFTDGTISIWKHNVLTVIDTLTEGPQIIVGSSMGGWLMLLAARERPEKTAAIIGIASAPDFTKNLMWDKMTNEQQKELTTNGSIDLPSDYSDEPYPTTLELIEDGKKHLLLDSAIEITCPVQLIHGMKDDDVPYTLSVALAEKLTSQNVQTHLIKKSDHRMSSDDDIAFLLKTIEETLANLEKTQ